LNQRINDISKSIFKLKIEENYCTKFKLELKHWVEKQENMEAKQGKGTGAA